MTEMQEKLKAYSCAWWGNAEIGIVTGLAQAEVSKIKQQVVRAGGNVPGHGSKVYRDAACKILGINVKNEIENLKLILG